uniref:Bifunctional dihydrofolate reductase-thymidylate synthase n=1 Tax=Peronospora matthiolae TaxID=2874970 RepID=A0AAV1U5C1_9STRA
MIQQGGRKVSLIVACSLNRVIGKQGKLPWNIPADWAFFCSVTMNQVLIVGRRSFEEFDEPIPNRQTIVVSSTLEQTQVKAVSGRKESGVRVARTLAQALELVDSEPQYLDCTRVFIGGGENLYKEAMAADVVESCYVSRIHRSIDHGDTFFPRWTARFPNLVFSAKTNGRGSTRVSFEVWTRQQGDDR